MAEIFEENKHSTPEEIDNVPEQEPKDELGELNARLEKLLNEWSTEYDNNKGLGHFAKKHFAKGEIVRLLQSNMKKTGPNFDLELGVMRSEGEGGDFTMTVHGYDGDDSSKLPYLILPFGDTEELIVVNEDGEKSIKPDEIYPMIFTRPE